MGSLRPSQFHVKAVAVIGAGPSGIAAARHLRSQGTFDRIVIFEQQHQVGGVWNYSPIAPGPYPVPQTNPFFPPDAPVSSPAQASPVFPSPMYEKLHANIIKPLMQVPKLPFPADSWIFPSREDIQNYLINSAREVRDLIHFDSRVTNVSLAPGGGRDRWRIQAHSTVDERVIDGVFDAVVVANGHYSVPFIPDITNIASFHNAHPSIIIHSKQYRRAQAFKDKKVVVVGNGPSGADIALQINQVSKGRTILSVRTATPPGRLAFTGCEEVPEIEEFLVDQRGVRFKNGRIETNIDAVVFSTGYLFSFPFLPDLQTELVSDGRSVYGLYKHLFHIRHPTLAFASLLVKVIPLHVAEAQAAAIAAVWSGNLDLPPTQEMERWRSELEATCTDHSKLLMAGDGYINELHEWVMQADHVGTPPPWWDDETFWQRSQLMDAKLRFEQRDLRPTTFEELGFRYNPETTIERTASES
ncbi:hypothetical protein HIM_06464 [Hirsutella minnesotensis 3608]|uniref:Thiol-specific monooxygenase n=1 Tax=Hirsutella minnesotensis 3608 TaxID=1043627 RepID=A0A0F7ZU47_9HYPO|nr:hypothetical protein HIM_06464 [Hirsutella minnesotensis 3608]